MRNRVIWLSKKVLAMLLTLAAIASVIFAALPTAQSKASYNTLNSNRALGSPVINTSNFTTENWNKWETICWGVFLSNFCVPFFDTYETAFDKTKKSGSQGRGFDALWGGSGSDSANKEVVDALTKYAIEKQKSVTDDNIYVQYVDCNGKVYGKVRPAEVRDLFFFEDDKGTINCPYDNCAYKGDSDHKHTKIVYTDITADELDVDSKSQYDSINTCDLSNTMLPIFYVYRGTGTPGSETTGIDIRENEDYIKIFDYSDWWDVQVVPALINAVPDEYMIEALQGENSLFSQDMSTGAKLKLDYFGNIVTNGNSQASNNKEMYIIIPSAVNQHITTTMSINVLNSCMVNSYVSSASDTDMILKLSSQRLYKGFTAWLANLGTSSEEGNGLPAIAGTEGLGDLGIFYYDTDSIIVQHYRNNSNVKYGQALSELFALNINDDINQSIFPLKFEVVGGDNFKKIGLENFFQQFIPGAGETIKNSTDFYSMFTVSMLASQSLTNENFKMGTEHREILSEILLPNGSTLPMFSSNGLVIPVRALPSTKSEEPTDEGYIRNYMNYLYKCAMTEDSRYGMSSEQVMSALEDLEDADAFEKIFSNAWGNKFKVQYPLYKNHNPHTNHKCWLNLSTDGSLNNLCEETERCILVFTPSEQLRACSQVLGIKDGAEFTTYCTYIYMTYLDFYGVATSREVDKNAKNLSKFNEKIYNNKRELITDIGQTMNEYSVEFGDQISIQDEVTNYGYLMLSPENGREYRKQMTESAMADWMYEQYNKVVYGGASEFSGTASKAKSGFLSIETLADNWFTSFFIENYTNIAIWLIMGTVIIIIIAGLFKGKKFSWFIISIIIMINAILLVPASGDIVPYITSSATQNMFNDKMTYWAISQGITNASIEKDLVKTNSDSSIQHGILSYNDSLSDDEAKQIAYLVKNLASLQTDTSLSVKQDISQKITQTLKPSVYAEIQSYKSARWILPMIMQQFSASNEDEIYDYVYKPLANIWADLSNMYWFYDPANAVQISSEAPTVTSNQVGVPSSTVFTSGGSENDSSIATFSVNESAIRNHFSDYVDSSSKPTAKIKSNIDFRFKSMRSEDNYVHRVCYYLMGNNITVPLSSRQGSLKNEKEGQSEYVDADSWGGYISKCNSESITHQGAWKSVICPGTEKKTSIEDAAGEYDREDRQSIKEVMPYLWSTESPIYYFYAVVKDSFDSNNTVGHLIKELQGTVYTETTSGEMVRDNFMYAKESTGDEYNDANGQAKPTGYLRDILDFEEMFSNMIPYMYQMSICANGFDGESGVIHALRKSLDSSGEYISESSSLYKGELRSWWFRCNWATKIMENPTFSEAVTVRDKEGNKYTVKNPLLVEYYPENRPMVFSEAQMYAMGLSEDDLNIVELKCLEAARRVARQWTLILNYVTTPGINQDILMKQMATDATMIFCDEFSSSGILDTAYEIYPQSLDLRYISFDSIMKMLMLNISKNTSYIYGDTMLTVIQSSDTFTAVLLFIAAWLCSFLIPLFRSAMLAVIFYLGIWALIRGLFYTNKVKGNMACGQLISNLLFMAYTLIYYSIFAIMTARVSSDELLSIKTVTAEAGSPAWVLLFVIVISIAYMVAMGFHIVFCFKNRGDMGFEKFSALASGIAGSIKDGVGKVKDKVSSFFDRDGSDLSTSNTKSIKGTGSRDNTTTIKVSKGDADNTEIVVKQDNSPQYSDNLDSDYSTNFSYESDEIESDSADEINAIIDTGSSMDNKS